MDIRKQRTARQSFEELQNIYQVSLATEQIEGAIVEIGVYKGGSAKLIADHANGRHIYLFDSFEGMHRSTEHDKHKAGDFDDTSVEGVRAYLGNRDDISLHPGWFPESAEGVEIGNVSFVHLDVDLYESTLDGLRYFYPKLTRGGMILSHDYNSLSCPGVAKAFGEFFADKPESVVELAGTTQCLVVKL